MKLTEEQIKNMETEVLEELVKNAFASEDMEFLLSVLPKCYDYHEGFYSDFFIDNFDNDAFKNRDIALILAECGYLVPEDLYENDEEVILASVAPGADYNGFYIASDKLLSDKNFVIKMLSQINWSEELREVSENIDSYVPREVLEDEEFKEFIKSRIQELKEKEDYEEMSALEERRMVYYGEYSSQRKFYPSFLDFLKEKELIADGAEKSVIQDLIRSEENDKEQSEETSETPSELEQLASTKKELEQIVSELKKNIASAQKLLASYEELLNGRKQNDSNEGQTFGEE